MFYDPTLHKNTEGFVMREEESKHCVRVLRKKTGDIIELLDGNGGYYRAEILLSDPKKCTLKVVHYDFFPCGPKVHLAVAPTKNLDRMEWLIEKGTELGCTHFSLIITHRTERVKVNGERLHKIAVAAMKQSQRYYLPQIDAPQSLQDFLSSYPGGWIAHCLNEEKSTLLNPSITPRILIGPEGDFTPEEIQHALQHQYRALGLGAARLRTETAALKAVIMLSELGEHA
ncbi:MAG: 16S rRNA (uracil(1498)-N(3))-methyltransferase [Flavobacteriia bacterium]|nr:16S rRNA (uracil(1498)-N(3))-methyltransferase [Flavobacteriia bacterium]